MILYVDHILWRAFSHEHTWLMRSGATMRRGLQLRRVLGAVAVSVALLSFRPGGFDVASQGRPREQARDGVNFCRDCDETLGSWFQKDPFPLLGSISAFLNPFPLLGSWFQKDPFSLGRPRYRYRYLRSRQGRNESPGAGRNREIFPEVRALT